MKEHEMSYKDLAEKVKMPEATLKKVVEEKKAISLHYLEGLARILNVYWSQLVLDVQFTPSDPPK